MEWNSGSYIMNLFSFRGSCQISIAWEFEFFYILVNTYFLFLSFWPFWHLFTDVVWGFNFYFFGNWWTEQLFICLLNNWIYSFLSLSVSGFFCIFNCFLWFWVSYKILYASLLNIHDINFFWHCEVAFSYLVVFSDKQK